MRKKHFENPKKLIAMRSESLSLNELFPRFVAAKIAEGVSDKTVESYYNHWKCIGKHLDLDRTFEDLTQDDINNVLVSMRNSGLAHTLHQQLHESSADLSEVVSRTRLHDSRNATDQGH